MSHIKVFDFAEYFLKTCNSVLICVLRFITVCACKFAVVLDDKIGWWVFLCSNENDNKKTFSSGLNF
jgi:hypothetical protein